MCGKELEERPLETSGALSRACFGCQGYWFEKGQLSRWLGTHDDLPEFKLYIIQAAKSHLTCPHCHVGGMLQMPYSSAEIMLVDWCPNCRGIWLNVGELTEVTQLGRHLRGETRLEKPRVSTTPTLRWILFFGISLFIAFWITSWLTT